MTSSGQPHRIWGIPEIVEHILLNLPIQDLLLSQRICSSWQATIRSSRPIQESLFLKATKTKGSATSHDAYRRYNPLLVKNFPNWFPTSKIPYSESCTHMKELPWAPDGMEPFLRRDASWRRMLLSQPPIEIYEQVHVIQSRGGNNVCKATGTVPDGIRMGFAYDGAQVALWVQYGSFYTVTDDIPMDGTATSEMTGAIDDAPVLSQEEQSANSRVFGGKDRFMLVRCKVLQCKKGHPDPSKKLLESAGFEEVTMDMKPIERSPTVTRTWWTQDGRVLT